MHQLDVRYTEPLVREAVNAFYWRTLQRRFGWPGWAALALTVAAFCFLIVTGGRSWLVGFMGAAILFVLLIFAIGYMAHTRNTTRRFARMAEPPKRVLSSRIGMSRFRRTQAPRRWRGHPSARCGPSRSSGCSC